MASAFIHGNATTLSEGDIRGVFDMARNMAHKLASMPFTTSPMEDEVTTFDHVTLGVYHGEAADEAAKVLQRALPEVGFPVDTEVISDLISDHSKAREISITTSKAAPVSLQQLLVKIGEIQAEQAKKLLH